jgi:hypothetical protein
MRSADGNFAMRRGHLRALISVPVREMPTRGGCLGPSQRHQLAQIAQGIKTADPGDQSPATLQAEDGFDETDELFLEAATLIRRVGRSDARVMPRAKTSAVGE